MKHEDQEGKGKDTEIKATTGIVPIAVRLDKPIEYFKIIGALVGNLSGIIALATIIYGGGALVQSVKDLKDWRIKMDLAGSPGLQTHEKLDDYRDKVMTEEIKEYRQDVKDLKKEVEGIHQELSRIGQAKPQQSY